MKRSLLVLIIGSLFLVACSTNTGSIPYASIPAGMAYAEGSEIYFSHTEASDSTVAEKLTAMMKSPVLVVPSLAEASDSMLADVYVFQNGVTGSGPLGFQPDVFNNPPGSEGYSPLRKIIFATWQNAQQAKILKSEAEITAAVSAGEIVLEPSDVVVNMPFMTWDGGKR